MLRNGKRRVVNAIAQSPTRDAGSEKSSDEENVQKSPKHKKNSLIIIIYIY